MMEAKLVAQSKLMPFQQKMIDSPTWMFRLNLVNG